MAALNYNHLRYFHAVAHDGNLTRAAARLNLSQSALSVQIRKLERQLGHDLFERRGRELVLTEAGRIALDHADAVFRAGDELVGTLRETGRGRRALRVGALSTLSRNFIIRFLRPVLGREDVDVIMRSGGAGELMRALAALDLDVALTNRAPAEDAATAFTARRLYAEKVSLVGAPARVGRGGPLADLLRAHPVILPASGDSVRLGFDALADSLGLRPQIAAEVDDMAMMRLLAAEDVGLAVLPPIVVTEELGRGALIEAAQLPEIVETFHAVTVARRFPNPLVRELLDAAEAAAG